MSTLQTQDEATHPRQRLVSHSNVNDVLVHEQSYLGNESSGAVMAYFKVSEVEEWAKDRDLFR